MCKRYRFTGTVRDGTGSAAREVERGLYPPALLGFEPYAGSLNLDVTAAIIAEVRRHPHDFSVYHAGIQRLMWAATTADGHPCIVQWHAGMPAHVVEVFSPHHLRSRFGLTNGWPVTITLAAVAELADATDSRPVAYGRAGSSPAGGTREEQADE